MTPNLCHARLQVCVHQHPISFKIMGFVIKKILDNVSHLIRIKNSLGIDWELNSRQSQAKKTEP